MSLAIATQTRGPQISNAMGGVNPFEMMHSMFELRNMQQQYQSNIEAGQIVASSPDMDTAIERLRQSPNAAWQIPIINQIREGQLTQAHVTQTQWDTDASKIHEAVRMSTGPGSLMQTLGDARKNVNPGNAWLADDVQKSLMYNLPSDPVDAASQFEKNRIALLLGTGLTAPEAYAAHGFIPPGIQRIPGPMGGPDRLVPVGGVPRGGGAMGGVEVPQLGEAATGPQMSQWQDLEKRRSNLSEQVDAGNTLMQNVNEASGLLSKIETGAITPLRTDMANLAMSLGAGKPIIDIIRGGTDVAAAQEFNKLMFSQIMNQVNQQLPPGSRLNMSEYRDATLANPSLTMQRQAIQRVFDMWRRAYITNRMQQKFLGSYMSDHANEPGAAVQWDPHWNAEIGRRGLLAPHYKSFKDEGKGIDPEDVISLLGHDNPKARAKFDETYGPGAAANFLDE